MDLSAGATGRRSGFLARHAHKDGVELKRAAFFDRYASSTKGRPKVASVRDDGQGGHTMRADLMRDAENRPVVGTLLDVELGWIAEERFAVFGLHQHAAYEDRPARLVHQGWLCKYEIEEPEDDRPRRKNGALR